MTETIEPTIPVKKEAFKIYYKPGQKPKGERHIQLHIDNHPMIKPPPALFIGVYGNRQAKYREYLDKKFASQDKAFFDFLCELFRIAHEREHLVITTNWLTTKYQKENWVLEGFVGFLENIKTPMYMVLGLGDPSSPLVAKGILYNQQ